MRHTTVIPFLFLPLLLPLSCGKERYPSDDPCGPSLELRLEMPGPMDTKSAVDDGVESLSVYVYRTGRTNAPVYSATSLPVSEGRAKTFIPGDLLAAIGSQDGGTASLCVVANTVPDITGAPSVEAVLSSRASTPAFADGTPSGLPMSGTGTATLSADGKTLAGTVSMRRSAAKLEVRITDLSSNIVDGVSTYTPDTGHLQLTLQNAMKAGSAGGLRHPAATTSADRFNRTQSPLARVDDSGGDFLYYTHAEPFYSYASDWSADEDRAVTFLLVVPWSDDGGLTYKKSYYQIPVNPAGLKIEENTHYIINMRIGIVGSFEEELPVVLTPSVVTQPWGSVSMTETNIAESRYLVVGNDNLTLDNTPDATIQFASSHSCVILSKSLRRAVLSSVSEAYETIDESEYTVTLDNDSGLISFYHELNNSGGSDADFAPYELTLVIAHESRPAYQREIHITQNPMISVVGQENSDGTGSAHNGYTYVNKGTNLSYYGNGCNGLTGSNKNPKMYIITIAAFDEGSSYTIGDPRTSYVNNILTAVQGGNTSTTYTYNASWSASAPSLSGGTRRLSYYHPAESSERTKNMIAPKFRVASSYGACNAHKFTNMERRCAAYQEDGYPAGRWRLPTAAEILYITSLSDQETIPELFTIGTNDTDGYWCANGWVGGDANGKPTLHENVFTGNNYVRCVYDEWFWGDGQLDNRSTFTWGDTDY